MIWVIIPTYNEEKALPHTIRSVLSQSTPYQVIVVDGGSTDRTLEVLRQTSQISWCTAPKGRASQMNAGARFVIQQQASVELDQSPGDQPLPHRQLRALFNRPRTRWTRSRTPQRVTITRASRTMLEDILETPSLRSRKVMGISTMRPPAFRTS